MSERDRRGLRGRVGSDASRSASLDRPPPTEDDFTDDFPDNLDILLDATSAPGSPSSVDLEMRVPRPEHEVEPVDLVDPPSATPQNHRETNIESPESTRSDRLKTPKVLLHVSGQHPDDAPAPMRSRSGLMHRRRSLVLAVTAAAVLVAAVAAVLGASRSTNDHLAGAPGHPTPKNFSTTSAASHPNSPTSPSVTPAKAAIRWLGANFPNHIRVASSPALVDALRQAGFIRATTLSRASGAPALFVGTQSESAGSTTLRDSTRVAQFGHGVHAVQLRSLKEGRRASARDRADRRVAGRGLLRNPRLHVPATLHRLLRSGDLDLRAETFLALLTARVSVELVTVHQTAVEHAVGRPLRTIVVRAPQATIRAIAASLPDRFVPSEINAGTVGVAVTWPVALAPVRPAS